MRVTAAAERALRGGHPWVFADSVRDANRPGQLGELAVIFDREDRFLAIGLHDPDSPLAVRVLHTGKPVQLDDAWWRNRWLQTRQARKGLFDEGTTGYRCIYGESDGFPGLVLDRYGETFVLKLYTAAWLPRLESVMAHLIEVFRPGSVVLRLSRNIQELVQQKFGHCDGQLLFGALARNPVIFLESGLRFEADVVRGQKTGFFLDQRDSRIFFSSASRDQEILNAFSYSGAFSVYAFGGGAKEIISIDSSRPALELAEQNLALNGFAEARGELLKGDAFVYLKETDRKFDLIVLDPPSLAHKRSDVMAATGGYKFLNLHALNHLKPGGMLLTFSCSQHLSTDLFQKVVFGAAVDATRKVSIVKRLGHPIDHPISLHHPEGEYLKGLVLRVLD